MKTRHSLPNALRTLSYFPALALLGPRQCGKTTLAKEIARQNQSRSVYLDLERPEDLALLDDAPLFLRAHRGTLLIFDEVQRAPDLFNHLRSEIDERRSQGERAGHFLLLGSASRELLAQSSESLAGRIDYLELTPFSINELNAEERQKHWLRGGFPDSCLAPDDAFSYQWRRAYLSQVIERDVPFFAPRLPAPTLRRLWAMLAANQGGLLNATRIAQSLGMSGQSISRYLALLVELFHVRELLPWSGNVSKRLTKAPKYYVRDSGLLHSLLEVRDQEALLRNPIIGASFEGYVIEQIISLLGADWRYSFYRTQHGAEIDLIAQRGEQCLAIEIKRASKPVPSAGFYAGAEIVQATHKLILHAGERDWELGNNTLALSSDNLLTLCTRLGL